MSVLLKPNRLGCFIALIVVVAVVLPLGITAFSLYSSLAPVTTSQDISMQPHPTVIVDHESNGVVRVHANTGGNEVKIEGWKDGMSYTQVQATNTLNIDMSEADALYENITITTPANTDLKISASNVEIFGITGQMQIIATTGMVTLAQSVLTGNTSITAEKVIFQGKFDPHGTYSFDTNSGSVDLTLPAEASFHLDITGILGPVASTFPSIEAQVKGVDITELHADVGNVPRATIKLSVNSTLIAINGV